MEVKELNMAGQFSRFDIAEHLKTPEDCTLFLQACMEDGGAEDPAVLANALGAVARARGISQLSRDTGITREGLYKALSEGGNPSYATIVKVLAALGMRFTILPLNTAAQ
jgi:probable addiction module antidote protein